MTDYRAVFDATITFLNEGGIQVQGFRIDVDGPDTSARRVGELLVQHLGLLMVDRVDISDLRIVAEAHKGSRGTMAADAATSTRLVDLSHPIEAGMITYPGLPSPVITPYLTREASRARYAEGIELVMDTITMLGNTGTYLDSPYHRYDGGVDLAALPLERLAALPAIVAHVMDSRRRGIDAHALASLAVAGRAVLLHTGWDRHWRTDRYNDPAPFLTEDGARWLVDNAAALVGIDSINIDDNVGRERPAHSVLLEAGIPIVEHMTNLAELPAAGATLHAVPLAIERFGTCPVRAYAMVPVGGSR